MGDWLGTGNIAPENRYFRPFEEAGEFVHSFKLKDYNEWKEYCRPISQMIYHLIPRRLASGEFLNGCSLSQSRTYGKEHVSII
jgi:hypothetical protein